jgi:hypothetical protein
MSRKPAHILADLKRPQGRDVMWSAIRALHRDQGAFTRLDVMHRTRIDDQTIYSYLLGLTKAGYLRCSGHGQSINHRGAKPFNQVRYELVNDVGVHAPRVTKSGKPVIQGIGQRNLWRCMRILLSFSVRELAAAAAVSHGAALDYVRRLKRAQYLVVVGQRSKQHGLGYRYALAAGKNTGPLAPMIQRDKSVFDPNLNKVAWRAGVSQEAA